MSELVKVSKERIENISKEVNEMEKQTLLSKDALDNIIVICEKYNLKIDLVEMKNSLNGMIEYVGLAKKLIKEILAEGKEKENTNV